MAPEGRIPLSLEADDPTWYLAWDLAGTWFGAIGTILAAAVATWLGVRAIQDQNAQREERDRAQADRMLLLRRAQGGSHFLTLRNDSDLPITDVRVISVGALDSELVIRDHVGPGEAPDYRYQGVTADVIAGVEFVDAAGHMWVKTPGTGYPFRMWHRESGRNSLHAKIEDSEHGPAVTALLLRWQNNGGHAVDLPLEEGRLVVGPPRIVGWGRFELTAIRVLGRLRLWLPRR